MIKFELENTIFSARGVGIVIHDNKLLVQKRKNDKFWALPGGRIEMGEKSAITPVRELEEEIGTKRFKTIRLLYICESFFKFKDTNNHQIAFYYLLQCPDDFPYFNKYNFNGIEQDKDIVYTWLDLNDIKNQPLKPDFLKTELLNITNEIKHIVEDENE